MKNFSELVSVLFTNHWRHSVMLLLNACLTLLLLAILIYQSYAVVTLLTTSPDADKKNTTKNHAASTSGLFGSTPTTSPPSTINWSLKGIITGDRAENNYAIIASSDANETIYKLGDKLADNSTVLDIQSDRVLLTHNGETQTLNLPVDADNLAITNTITHEQPIQMGKPYSSMKEP